MAEPPTPLLKRFFESAAGSMAIDQGRQRLELIFEAGRLVQWWTHAEKKPAGELGQFNREAAWILAAGGDV
jgi:hypothetical protein